MLISFLLCGQVLRFSYVLCDGPLLLFAFNLLAGGNQVIPSLSSTAECGEELICHPLSDTHVFIQVCLIFF